MMQHNTSLESGAAPLYFLKGGGEMGALIEAFDWSQGPLGVPQTWPGSLRTALQILLRSRFPMFLFWGTESVCFYNDAYSPSLVGKDGRHPSVLGRPASEVWRDSWDIIGAEINLVMQHGASTFQEDQLVPVYRNGRMEQAYWTYSYSPVADESGAIAGVFVACNETTKQVESQTRLSQSLQLSRSVLEQAPDPILIFKGPEMILEMANEPLYRIWGVDESALGKPFLEILPEMKDQIFPELLLDVLRNDKTVKGHEVPAAFLRADGTVEVVYLNFIFQPYRESDGVVSGVLVMGFDVTEQVLVRARMRKSEERMNALVTTTPDVVFRMNADWTELSRLDGKGFIADVPGPMSNWMDAFVPPSEQARVREAVSRAIQDKAHFVLEHQIKKKDGSLGWTASRAVPIINESGHITEWFGFTTDITRRRLVEMELIIAHDNIDRSKRLYETIMDTTPDLIYVFDRKYRVSYANKALLAMWGLSWEEARGRELCQLGYTEKHAAMHEREIDEVIATGKLIRGTVSFPHAVLGVRFYDYIFSPVFGDSGEVEAVAGTTRDITDFKFAEDALVQQKQLLDASVERFDQINRATQDAVWDWNLMTNEVFWNEAVTNMFGYEPSEAGNSAAWRFAGIHPEDRERVVNHIHESIANGVANWEGAYRFRCADGGYKTVYDRGFVLQDQQGVAIRMLGSMQDITGRKRADAILSGQKKAFEQAVQSMPLNSVLETIVHTAEQASRNELLAAVMLTDEDGKHLNHGAAYGLPQAYNEAVSGIAIGPEAGSCGTAAYYGHEIVARDIENDPHWKDYKDVALAHGLRACWSTPIKSSMGRQLGTFAIYYKEISEPSPEDREIVSILSQTASVVIEWVQHKVQREAAETAMRESEERFRVLAETLPQMIWMNDPEGTPLYRSRQWAEYFDCDPHTAWQQYCQPGDRAASEKAFALARERGCSFRSEVRLKNKANEYRWHASIAEPLKDSNGAVIKWIGALIDIHDQKTISEKLERLVHERTAELLRSNEDLQQFAHVASHDLKEPVRKITTFAKMMEDLDGPNLSNRGRICLEKVQNAAERMMNMVNGVLGYSQLAAAEQIFETIDLAALIQSAQTDLEVLIQQKNATITLGELPAIAGAPVLIHQLFYNLINNALKFSRRDVPPVITITGVLQENDMVRIVLEDNGIGFEQEYAERIFKTFSRLNSKDSYEGTGLGLALCRKIVTRHRGAIAAEGELNKGARFILSLPAAP